MEISHQSDTELLSTLQQAAADLTWMSESDYPFEGFCWEDGCGCDDRKLLQLAQEPEDAPLETVDLDSFFEVATQPQDWHGEAESETVQKYQTLVSLIKQHLSKPKVYRVGSMEVRIYVVGQTPNGNLVGLKTTAIET
jgi:predicted peptidase